MLNYSVGYGLILIQGTAPDGKAFMIWAVLGIVIGIIIGVLIALALRKPKGKQERAEQTQQQQLPQLNTPPLQAPARRAATHARRCPVCNSTYTDDALIYCVSDGASLVPVINNLPTHDPQATLLYREGGNRDVPPTVPSRPDENQK
jgi:hypothetical protein